MLTVHASAVAVGRRGVLLRGLSGAGKSDLALRLMSAGAVLVADDQVQLECRGGELIASPPEPIAGLIEVRGVGIRRVPFAREVPLALVVDLVAPDAVERFPEPSQVEIAGAQLPLIRLNPFEPSAAAKIVLALDPASSFREPAGAVGPNRFKEPRMDQPSQGEGASARARGEAITTVLLVTGMSGAGRSSALKILEDIGYEAVDNLPLSLLLRLVGSPGPRPIAVGVDIRTRDFGVATLIEELDRLLADKGLECRIVFLECDDEVLARRYTETRRRHPLAGDRPVVDGIKLERNLVAPLRDLADLVIDTSILHTSDLKRILAGNFARGEVTQLSLFVTSFSFREGLPREADLVFDVRFLSNPHYVPELRELTGLDSAVADYIEADSSWAGFFQSLTTLLQTLLPRYDSEGKSYLTVAIGCTGGRHRSVHAAERLGAWLRAHGHPASIAHRDVARAPAPGFTHFAQPVGTADPMA